MHFFIKIKYAISLLIVCFLSFSPLAFALQVVDAAPDGDGVRQNINPPIATPNIITGQKASLYVSIPASYDVDIDWNKRWTFDLDAWKATGLFSSVAYANSRTPTTDGVFIVRECDSYNNRQEQGVYAKGLVSFFSLGTIPVLYSINFSCNLELYQNGTLLAKNQFYYIETLQGGISAEAYDSYVAWKKEAQMSVNNLLSFIK